MKLSKSVLLAISLFGVSSVSQAQILPQLVNTLTSPSSLHEEYGGSSAVGDLNGDGIKDVAIGDRYDSTNNRGYVEVRNGTNITTHLFTAKTGSHDWQHFGAQVAITRALGQACGTLWVGSPQYKVGGTGSQRGAVQGFNGCNGQLLFTIVGSGSSTRFGEGLVNLGDINGDNVDDVAVGSPNENLPAGAIRIYSGANPTGAPLKTINGSANDFLGKLMAVGPDILNNGRNTLMVGNPYWKDSAGVTKGRVRIINPVTGAVITNIHGGAPLGSFGASFATLVGSVGTVGSPAQPSNKKVVIVGAPQALAGGTTRPGRAAAFLIRNNGNIVKTVGHTFGRNDAGQLDHYSYFGAYVGNVGDLNGDGVEEYAVSQPGADPGGLSAAGKIVIFKGGTVFQHLATIKGASVGQNLGESALGSAAPYTAGFHAFPRPVGSNYLLAISAAHAAQKVQVYKLQ